MTNVMKEVDVLLEKLEKRDSLSNFGIRALSTLRRYKKNPDLIDKKDLRIFKETFG